MPENQSHHQSITTGSPHGYLIHFAETSLSQQLSDQEAIFEQWKMVQLALIFVADSPSLAQV